VWQWSVRREPCARGAWRHGIGRGKAVVEVQRLLVGWNAAPGLHVAARPRGVGGARRRRGRRVLERLVPAKSFK
jgi:hypothetical protein